MNRTGLFVLLGAAVFLTAIGVAAFRVTGNLADQDIGDAPLALGLAGIAMAALIGFFLWLSRRGR